MAMEFRWERHRKQTDSIAIPLSTPLFLLDVDLLVAGGALVPTGAGTSRARRNSHKRGLDAVLVMEILLGDDVWRSSRSPHRFRRIAQYFTSDIHARGAGIIRLSR